MVQPRSLFDASYAVAKKRPMVQPQHMVGCILCSVQEEGDGEAARYCWMHTVQVLKEGVGAILNTWCEGHYEME